MMKAGTEWFLFHLLIAHFCERKLNMPTLMSGQREDGRHRHNTGEKGDSKVLAGVGLFVASYGYAGR
jgi:hypothetical protein